MTEEAKIDGMPVSEIITLGSGGYEYIDKPSAAYISRLKRYTVFVGYGPYDPGDPENGPRVQFSSIEEIDVNAQDASEARIIGELALMWHYEPNGHIMHVEERFGLYI